VAEGADRYQKFASNYLEVRNDPLYPFGYGLSYTTFAYSELSVDGRTARCTVTNTGHRDGDEVVQLYIRDLVADVSRPVKELKGFQRIHLKAGEQREVTFEITPDMLQYYDINGNIVPGDGEFDIMVGSNSRDVLSTRLVVD
jgi:beta-glucosidase